MRSLWRTVVIRGFRLCRNWLNQKRKRAGFLRFSVRWLYRNRQTVYHALLRGARKIFEVSPGRTNSQTRALLSLKVHYINLNSRPDRREQFELQADQFGIPLKRFAAVEREFGPLGCVESHINVLEEALLSGERMIFVAEDDFELLVAQRELLEILTEFDSLPELDVLCLAHNAFGLRVPVSNKISISHSIFTTAGYIVRSNSAPELLECFRRSKQLLESGSPPSIGAIDVVWQEAQIGGLLFGIARKRAGRQRESFSDITKMVKNYGV